MYLNQHDYDLLIILNQDNHTLNENGNHNHIIDVSETNSGGHSHNVEISEVSKGDHKHNVKVEITDDGSHNHNTTVTENNVGESKLINNEPQYFVLAYIMRIN